VVGGAVGWCELGQLMQWECLVDSVRAGPCVFSATTIRVQPPARPGVQCGNSPDGDTRSSAGGVRFEALT